MAPEPTYTLTDVARLADVTPRTIRYYISQGLLPSPGAGPGARYGEAHLARLRLIRRLQREHLPLAEIRRRLEERPSLTEADLPPPADSALDYIRRLREAPAADPSPAAAGAAPPGRIPLAAAPPAAPRPLPAASSVPASPAAPTSRAASPPSRPDRSTWERHALAPDVELHVRRPLDRLTSRQVERLIRLARELLADGT